MNNQLLSIAYTLLPTDNLTDDTLNQVMKHLGSMPFPVEIDFSTNMTVAPVVAGDGRHQGVLR